VSKKKKKKRRQEVSSVCFAHGPLLMINKKKGGEGLEKPGNEMEQGEGQQPRRESLGRGGELTS